MSNQIVTALRTVTIVILLVIILLPTLLGLAVVLWVFDLPRKVGQRLDFEAAIRTILYRVVDPQEMRQFRDEILHILESEVEVEGDPDRWGLLREIDQSQREIERRLKNGEFAFSFVGGVAALALGNLLGIVLGGVLLTIVGLLFSFLVTSRIIITETLCYRSVNVRNEPARRLVLFRGWNRGPIFGSGAIAVAVGTALGAKSSIGYELGRIILEAYVEMKLDVDHKWRSE